MNAPSAKRMIAVLLAASCLLAVSGFAWSQQSTFSERFPTGSIHSIEAADAALAAVAAERQRVDARYAEEERACQTEFFVTRCVDKARERRRQAAVALETIELEAERHKRVDRALQRDRALKERRASKKEEEAGAAASAEPAAPRKKAAPQETLPPDEVRPVKPEPTSEQRGQDAQLRAQNAAAYLRKVAAAQKRQEAVARKKAGKERQRAAKQDVSGAS